MKKKYAMVLGIALAVVAGGGVLVVRAAEESPAAPDIKKQADLVAKKSWDDLTRDGEAIAKKHSGPNGLTDVMSVFKLRRMDKEAKVIGIGVGDKPGAIVPDGIEAKIINLSRNATPADMTKVADLKRMTEIAAAVASVATHMPNEKARKTKEDIKKWQENFKGMHEGALELIKALESKNRVQVKAAAMKLHGTCTKCHSDYRDDD
ncbi:MAG TPA: cytochrome c [Gemmataceae bacterium]|nr:cytochrome c [Gemmataceae bacterium]